jgi:hypothetical protein
MTVALWSDLELEVAADMIKLDYDPYNAEDVAFYWMGLLDGE